MTRCVLAGKHAVADELQKRVYTHVLKAFINQISSKFSPGGMKAQELDQIGRSILAPLLKDGFSFIHSTGHGLGINDHELAITISASSRLRLQNGFCYSIEPGVYQIHSFPKHLTFGVRLEDIVMLQDNGDTLYHECLNPYVFDQRLIESSMLDETEKEYLSHYLKFAHG